MHPVKMSNIAQIGADCNEEYDQIIISLCLLTLLLCVAA